MGIPSRDSPVSSQISSGLEPSEILFQAVLVQCAPAGLFYGADVILIFAAERLVAVDLVLCHRLIRVAHPDIGALQPSLSGVEAGAVRHVHSGDLRRHKGLSILQKCRKHRADNRGHLAALLRHMLHEILGIVDAHRGKIPLFIYAEQKYSAFILVGETGQGVVEAGGTALGGGFQFQRLGFGFQGLCVGDQVLQFDWRHNGSLNF